MGGQRTLHCKNHIKASEAVSPADMGKERFRLEGLG